MSHEQTYHDECNPCMQGRRRNNSTVTSALVPFRLNTIVDLIEGERKDGQTKDSVKIILRWSPALQQSRSLEEMNDDAPKNLAEIKDKECQTDSRG